MLKTYRFLGKFESINQSELAEKMNIKKSTMVRLIDRMEKKEYIQRKKDINDRRIAYVCLTESGEKRRQELMPLGEDFSNSTIKDISYEEIEILKKVLDRLSKNVTN